MNALAKLLSVDDIVLDIEAFNKSQLFEQAAKVFAHRYGIDSALAQKSLLAREQLGSTGLGHGVAIPHARIHGLEQEVGLLVRTRLAIAFDAPDEKPVSMLLFLLVPEHANENHLELLANAVELFSDRDFREQFKRRADVDSVRQLLTK